MVDRKFVEAADRIRRELFVLKQGRVTLPQEAWNDAKEALDIYDKARSSLSAEKAEEPDPCKCGHPWGVHDREGFCPAPTASAQGETPTVEECRIAFRQAITSTRLRKYADAVLASRAPSEEWTCVRCNKRHDAATDPNGPPYVYCHECAVRTPAPSSKLVEAADAMRAHALALTQYVGGVEQEYVRANIRAFDSARAEHERSAR